MPDSLGQQLQELIRVQFGGIPKLASELGLPSQTLYSMCRKGVLSSSLKVAIPVAEALGIDPASLAHGRIEKTAGQEPTCVPTPIFQSPTTPDYTASTPTPDTCPIPFELHERYPNAFLLRVDGNSMDLVLPDGCYALVDPCETVDFPGKPYAVSIDDATTVKLVQPLANGFRLSPSSTDPTHQQTILDFNVIDPEQVSIVGRVVWYTLPFDWSFASPE